MAEYPTPQGGFTRGFQGGLQLGGNIQEIKGRAEDRKLEREKQRLASERQARQDKLEESKLIKERLLEGVDIADPKMRKLYFGQVIKHVEGRTGEKAPQWLAQLANSDPATFKQMMQAADNQGMTMLDIWKLGQNPLDSSAAILAFSKSQQADETRKVIGETNDPLVPSEATTSGPDAGLIASLQGRIANAKKGIANAVAGGASEAGIKALQARLETDEKYLFDLSKTRGSAETNEMAKPVPDSLLSKLIEQGEMGRRTPQNPNGAYPGITYGEVQEFYRKQRGAGTSPTQGGPTPAAGAAVEQVVTPTKAPIKAVQGYDKPTDPNRPQVRPMSTPERPSAVRVLPGSEPQGAMSESQEIRFRERQQLLNTPAPVWAQQEYGVTSMGEWNAGVASGKFKPITAAELVRRDEASRQKERVYGKVFEDIRTKAEIARTSQTQRESMLALLERAGNTGAALTPIRQSITNMIQAFIPGFNPEGMSELQMLSQFSTKQAIEDLKKVGGNDSDKDFMRAITSNPNIFANPETNLNMLIYGVQLDKLDQHRSAMAEKWLNAYGSLSKPDETGKSFDATWKAWAGKPENSAAAMLSRNIGVKNFKDLYKKFNVPYRGK